MQNTMNMLKRKLSPNILLSAMALALMTGCIKTNNIGQDNDNVILTPHAVLAGTDNGWIVKTNDGRTFNSVFPPDGSPVHMITAAGPNVLVLKSQLYLSDNGGVNFNPITYNKYKPQPWRDWVLNSPMHNRIYMSSTEGRGVAFSADSGRTWEVDAEWENFTSPNLRISSFAQLTNGSVYAFSDESNALYRRDNPASVWSPVLTEGNFPAPSSFFVVANTTDLFLVDYRGIGGAYYSLDEGRTWARYGDGELPLGVGKKFVSAASSLPGKLAIATEDDVYFATPYSSFEKANTGLDEGTKIYAITSKYNRYKGGHISTFLYMATSKGMYRSDDGGFSWDKVSFNEYNKTYLSIY